jgi:hypothetical protein
MADLVGVIEAAFRFDEPASNVQRGCPHLVQELAEPVEHLGSGVVEPPCAIAPFTDEPNVLEHGEVLRDGGPADVEMRGDLPRGQLLTGDELQDGPAARLGDRSQHIVDGGWCGQDQSPTAWPSGSANMAKVPYPPGSSVGGTSVLAPSVSALSR